MDDKQKQAHLDEKLGEVITEATQSRVSMTEALVLIRKMEKAGWVFANKGIEDELNRNAPAPEIAGPSIFAPAG